MPDCLRSVCGRRYLLEGAPVQLQAHWSLQALRATAPGPLELASSQIHCKMTLEGSNGIGGFLSRRSERASQPALSYGPGALNIDDELWSPTNPKGAIVLRIAENKLAADVLQEYMQKLGTFPLELYGYQSYRGLPSLREAFANYLSRTSMQGTKVNADHITVCAGAGAVIDLLFHCICSANDAVLIPAPYYPAFDNDLVVRNAVHPIPVHLREDEDLGPQLDAAADMARRQGYNVRALLWSNPTNPQGTVYGREQVLQMLRWCLLRRMHCISDEVYASSVFGEAPPFESIVQLVQQEAPAMPGGEHAADLVHVVFGMSKDFCASGMRIGCLYSRNSHLNNALDNLCYFCSASAHTQWMFERMFTDSKFLDHFLHENRQRLRHSYDVLSGALDEAGIPFIKSCAAMFTWVDLRQGLRDSSWEAEHELWQYLGHKHKLLLTPGQACHAARPGFFRMCWAWMPADSLPEAVRRMQAAIQERTAAARLVDAFATQGTNSTGSAAL